jgi:hypothetical protein
VTAIPLGVLRSSGFRVKRPAMKTLLSETIFLPPTSFS